MAYWGNYPTYNQNALNGRIINSIDEVSANDVSMQGMNVFPMLDRSAIYVKAWNGNGLIDTYKYELVRQQPVVNSYDSLMARIEAIEKRLDNGLQTTSNTSITTAGTEQSNSK